MILINEKEYLNLQEQVWRNAETIRCLLSGLKITGTGPTLPPDPEDQDAFLLQQDGKTYLSIYFEADQAWANLGEYPAVGPQGIPGPQGSAATIGAVECSTRTISAGDSASVEVSVDGTNLHFDFEVPQGAVGAQGPRGERGPQGMTGETGPRGPQGETGSSISIAGTLTSSSKLPDPETVPATTAYLVGLTAPYNLYVIVGAAGSRLWKDVGSVTPQNITVDASMSGSSQNPVQNRVVKQYVDAVKTTAEAAYTRSSLNLGRINTIQNVDLPDIYYELADLKEIVFETVAAVAAYVVDPAAFFVTPSYITIDNVAYPVIDDTDAEVAEILGSTVVWNQLAQEMSGTYWQGLSATDVSFSDGVATFTATAQNGRILPKEAYRFQVKAGHKYLVMACVKLTTGTTSVSLYMGSSLAYTAATTAWQVLYGIFEASADASGAWFGVMDGRASDWDAIQAKSPTFVDLSVAVPTDTPTDVSDERVQQLLQYALANPAYAAPAPLDFKIDSITSRGFNQWDEQSEFGNVGSIGGNFKCKTPMRVIPNATYYFYCGSYSAGGSGLRVQYLDGNMSPIKQDILYGTAIQMPKNCHYFVWGIQSSIYGTTYKHDICVNVSNLSLNGQYKPYKESDIDWESIIPDDEDRTARSAGTIRDVIYVRDDGNDTFSIVKRKNVGSYTFTGSENWNFGTGMTYTYGLSLGGSPNTYNLITDIEDITSAQIGSGDGNNIILRLDTGTYNNADKVRTLTSGKTITYELATPQETVLASGLLYDHVSFLIEKGGTIAINGGMPDALPGVEIDIPVKRFNE